MEKTESINVKESSSSNKNKSKYVLEFITEKIFMISALMAVVSLLLIIGFVFYKGLIPFVSEGYSFIDFIFGTEWLPSSKQFGIGSMIVSINGGDNRCFNNWSSNRYIISNIYS